MSNNNQSMFPWILMIFAAIGFVWSLEAVASAARRLLGL
jgi:hypothetical protein